MTGRREYIWLFCRGVVMHTFESELVDLLSLWSILVVEG